MSNLTLNTYEPDYVAPPGETLQEILEEQGMTQKQLALRVGYSPKAINEVIQGKSALSSELALALERVFGTPASFWNRSEYLYREYLARINESQRLEQHINWLEHIPYKAMIKTGWIKHFKSKHDQLIEILNFFGVTSPIEWQIIWEKKFSLNFRKSQSADGDSGAVIAWLRQGEIEANQIQCKPYNKKKFQESLGRIKSLSCQKPEFYKDELIKICAECGVAVVFVPALPKTKVWGVTHWLNPNKALIQLSLRYKKDDHFWFSFFHEAGHILLHSKKQIFLENEKEIDEKEIEADRFAADFLISPIEWNEIKNHRLYTLNIIKKYARELGISPGIIVGRLQKEKIIEYSYLNELKQNCSWI